jgi:integrase
MATSQFINIPPHFPLLPHPSKVISHVSASTLKAATEQPHRFLQMAAVFDSKSSVDSRTLQQIVVLYLVKLKTEANGEDSMAKNKRELNRFGMPSGHSHQLRDTFAVGLLLKRVPLESVSRALGHTSIKTTERYYSPWIKERQDLLDETILAAMRRGA